MAEMNIEDDLKSLREDMAALRSDLAKISEEVKALGKEKADYTKENLEDTAQGVRDEIRRIFRETEACSKKSINSMENEIVKHPFTSLFISLGAGIAIAKLLEGK